MAVVLTSSMNSCAVLPPQKVTISMVRRFLKSQALVDKMRAEIVRASAEGRIDSDALRLIAEAYERRCR